MDAWQQIAAPISPTALAEATEGQDPSILGNPRLWLASEEGEEAAANPAPDPLFVVGAPPPSKKRRGRPSHRLQQLVADHAGHSTTTTSRSASGSIETAPATTTPAQGLSLPAPAAPPYTAGGFLVGSQRGRPLCPAVLEMWPSLLEWAATEGLTLDRHVITIAEHFFNPAEYHLSSQAVLQKQLGLEHTGLSKRLSRLAATLLLQQIHQRRHLEKHLAQTLPSASLLCYLEAGAYDETPLRVNLKEPRVQGAEGAASGLASENWDDLPPLISSRPRSQLAISKVLQTKGGFAFLLALPTGFLGVIGQHIAPLQSMVSTSAGVLTECLARNSGVSPYVERFSLKCRSICTDKAPSNTKAEQILKHKRSGKWMSCLMHCELHALAGVHKKTFETFFKKEITGLIRCSLSLRMQGPWLHFQSALLEVVESRVVVLVGRCPASAMIHKKRLLALCADGSNHTNLPSLVKLLAAANGDWRNRQNVEVYVSSLANDAPKAVIAKRVAHRLCDALATTRPSLWRRDKWTGFKPAVLDIWLLDQIHGLLSVTYQKMTERLGDRLPGQTSGHSGDQAHRGAEAGHQLPHPHEAEPEPASGAHAASEMEQLASGQPQLQIGGQGGFPDNAKDRALAQKWLASQPAARLTLMLAALTPLEKMFHHAFQASGQEFEEKQRALAARGLIGGAQKNSTSRVQLASEGVLESSFARDLEALYVDAQVWSLLPDDSLTESFQGMAFRVLSRLGAAVHQLLTHEHSLYPTKLWRLLDHPEESAAMASDPICLKDEWTQAVQGLIPSLDGDRLRAVLRLQSRVQMLDIGTVESRHASVRRQVVQHSVQTWRMGLDQASAEWMFQNYRTSVKTKKQLAVRPQPSAQFRKVGVRATSLPPPPKAGSHQPITC